MPDAVVKKGRGFKSSSSQHSSGRLTPPKFLDDTIDPPSIPPPLGPRSKRRFKRPPPGQSRPLGANSQASPPIRPRNETHGNYKAGPVSRLPNQAAPHEGVPVKPKTVKVRPGHGVTYISPGRRRTSSASQENQPTIPTGVDTGFTNDAHAHISELNFTQFSRPTTIQTLEVALAEQSIDIPQDTLDNHASSSDHAAPHQPPQGIPAAIKASSGPVQDNPESTKPNSTPDSIETLTTGMEKLMTSSSDNLKPSPLPPNNISSAYQANNMDDVEEDGNPIQLLPVEEPYQLKSDEEFASESSDESESVTSTIKDYEDVSEAGSAKSVKRTKKTRREIIEENGAPYPVSVNEEPYAPLSFQIPTDELIRIVALKETNKLRVWSHTLYLHEDRKITVEYCTSFQEFETAAQKFLNEKAVGFDMEWLPRPSKHVWDNVSLMQLAKEDHIVLFHFARLKKNNVDDIIPPSLRMVLESKDILKTGVFVGGDGGRLRKWLGIEAQGLMELSAIHHLVEYARMGKKGQMPKVLVSLTRLSELYLQLPIAKGFVRISDWTRPLSQDQITYAATDAYAGFRLFDCLQKARLALDPVPMLPPCVKCYEDRKKNRVVTPKMYIEGATTPVPSTWDFEGPPTTGTLGQISQITETFSQSQGVFDWADDVEESNIHKSDNKPPTKRKRTAKKPIEGGEEETKKAKHSPPKKAESPPLTEDMQFATKWATDHKAMGGTASPARLKAYALWHLRNYSVEETATHMNVQVATAATYISNAVYTDRLQHDKRRMEEVQFLAPRYHKPGRRYMR